MQNVSQINLLAYFSLLSTYAILHGHQSTTSVPCLPWTTNRSNQSAVGHFIPFTTESRWQHLKVFVSQCYMDCVPIIHCEVKMILRIH